MLNLLCLLSRIEVVTRSDQIIKNILNTLRKGASIMASPNGDNLSKNLSDGERYHLTSSSTASNSNHEWIYNSDVNYRQQHFLNDPTHRNVQLMQNYIAQHGGAYGFTNPRDVVSETTRQPTSFEVPLKSYTNTAEIMPDSSYMSNTSTEGNFSSYNDISQQYNDTFQMNSDLQNQNYRDVPTNPKTVSRFDNGDNKQFLHVSDGDTTISYHEQTGKVRAIWKNRGGYIPLSDDAGNFIETYGSDDIPTSQKPVENGLLAIYNRNTQVTSIYDINWQETFSDSYKESLNAYQQRDVIPQADIIQSSEAVLKAGMLKVIKEKYSKTYQSIWNRVVKETGQEPFFHWHGELKLRAFEVKKQENQESKEIHVTCSVTAFAKAAKISDSSVSNLEVGDSCKNVKRISLDDAVGASGIKYHESVTFPKPYEFIGEPSGKRGVYFTDNIFRTYKSVLNDEDVNEYRTTAKLHNLYTRVKRNQKYYYNASSVDGFVRCSELEQA